MLMNSGLNFDNHSAYGIPMNIFGEKLMTSGLVLNENLHWVTFHGTYDLAYFIKLLTGQTLPEKELEFLDLLNEFFPNYYDIKFLTKRLEGLKGGLSRLAQELQVKRHGIQHQAGSDSIATNDVFFKLKSIFEEKEDVFVTGKNVVFGLGEGRDDAETINYVMNAVPNQPNSHYQNYWGNNQTLSYPYVQNSPPTTYNPNLVQPNLNNNLYYMTKYAMSNSGLDLAHLVNNNLNQSTSALKKMNNRNEYDYTNNSKVLVETFSN